MDEGLLHKKLRTLEQQRAQSDDLNALLTREGGLNESQYMTCKNLKAAVAVSKQPGFFEYHKHSAEVQRAYDRKTCNQMVKKIARTQQDLDAIEEDIRAREAARLKSLELRDPTLTSFDQWFQQFGRPQNMPQRFYSTFDDNKKIYGGTHHHRAFRSNARTMKLGSGRAFHRGRASPAFPARAQSRRPRGSGLKQVTDRAGTRLASSLKLPPLDGIWGK